MAIRMGPETIIRITYTICNVTADCLHIHADWHVLPHKTKPFRQPIYILHRAIEIELCIAYKHTFIWSWVHTLGEVTYRQVNCTNIQTIITTEYYCNYDSVSAIGRDYCEFGVNNLQMCRCFIYRYTTYSCTWVWLLSVSRFLNLNWVMFYCFYQHYQDYYGGPYIKA